MLCFFSKLRQVLDYYTHLCCILWKYMLSLSKQLRLPLCLIKNRLVATDQRVARVCLLWSRPRWHKSLLRVSTEDCFSPCQFHFDRYTLTKHSIFPTEQLRLRSARLSLQHQKHKIVEIALKKFLLWNAVRFSTFVSCLVIGLMRFISACFNKLT